MQAFRATAAEPMSQAARTPVMSAPPEGLAREGNAREAARPQDMSRRATSDRNSSVADDRADDRAGLHGPEGVVHLVEVDTPRDHGAEIEASRLGQRDEPREVAPHLRTAVHRAQDALV